MSLHPLEGHEDARAAVARSLRTGRLPPALLLHGPPGVGKQRFALWIGQLLLCQEPAASGPCGACTQCALATRIEHPDLHWYFPVKRPPARGSPERDREALEEVRAEAIAERRIQPLRPTFTEEIRGLHLGTIRNLKKEASRRPAFASRRLFLVADAEELVAQESSPEAANALLKLLEEPPPDTWFVLTSSEPGRLLPTVRSRLTALHMPSLPGHRVRAFLEGHWEGAVEQIERAVDLSGGSIGRALGYLPDGDEPGPLERIRQDAFFLLKAALDPRPSQRFRQALSFAPAGARGLHELLTSLETWIRDLAVAASHDETNVLNRDAEAWLVKAARQQKVHPVYPARALELVEAARHQAAGNVNPQLLLNGLLFELHDTLVQAAASSPSPTAAEIL